MVAPACGVDAMRVKGLSGCEFVANAGCAHFGTRSGRGFLV